MPLGHQGRQAAGAGVRADAALGTRGPASSVKTRRSRPGRWGSAGAARHCPRRPAKRTVLGPGTSPTGGVAHALGRSAWGSTHRLERGFHGQRGAALPVLSPVTPPPRPAQQRGCSACLQPAAPGPALSRFPCGHTGRCPRPAPVTAQAAVPRGWGHDAVCDVDVQPGAGAWAPPPVHALQYQPQSGGSGGGPGWGPRGRATVLGRGPAEPSATWDMGEGGSEPSAPGRLAPRPPREPHYVSDGRVSATRSIESG